MNVKDFLQSVDEYEKLIPSDKLGEKANENEVLFCECNSIGPKDLEEFWKESHSEEHFLDIAAAHGVGRGCGSCLKNHEIIEFVRERLSNKE